MKKIGKTLISYGLIAVAIYLCFNNHNYITEDILKAKQSFCDNYSETKGTLSDSLSVLKVKQNETYIYSYDYYVNGQKYEKTAPTNLKNKNKVPNYEATIFYNSKDPKTASTINPCKTLEYYKNTTHNKYLFYSGIAIGLVGIFLSFKKSK